jgi:CRP/FNR family transcriptional regulator, cyclic AMP receptor protein
VKPESLEKALSRHAFAARLRPEMLGFLAGCTKNERFEPGNYLFREGDRATRLYLIRSGRVALENHQPGRGTVTLETCEDGDVLGWTALFEPHATDGRALTPTLAFSIDGECLLRKMEADTNFGYAIAQRLLLILHRRLERARLQQLDIYRSEVR